MIITSHITFPIADLDWSAVDDEAYDWCSPVGYGATEADAIADLVQQLECA